MNDEFDAYLNLHAIGVWYKSTLPARLRATIDAYNSNLYLHLGGSTFHVRHADAAAPGGPAPASVDGITSTGPGYAPPIAPGPLGHGVVHGAELANLSAAMGGTLCASASPFIYIHPNNPGVRVNYGSDVTVKRFTAAWAALVAACANDPVNFAWPLAGNWNSDHAKVEFAAAALAETYRDPVQLGAIFVLSQKPFSETFQAENAWQTLPMCQGGSYNPMSVQVCARRELLVASTQVFQRCHRILKNDVAVPNGLDQLGVDRVSRGRSMNGLISAYQWDLSSKHYKNHVKYWYYL